MSKFKMEFYNAASGVVFILSWRDEKEFRMGQEFLRELVGGPAGRIGSHPDQPDFYYLKNEQERDALYAFRQKLQEK